MALVIGGYRDLRACADARYGRPCVDGFRPRQPLAAYMQRIVVGARLIVGVMGRIRIRIRVGSSRIRRATINPTGPTETNLLAVSCAIRSGPKSLPRRCSYQSHIHAHPHIFGPHTYPYTPYARPIYNMPPGYVLVFSPTSRSAITTAVSTTRKTTRSPVYLLIYEKVTILGILVVRRYETDEHRGPHTAVTPHKTHQRA